MNTITVMDYSGKIFPNNLEDLMVIDTRDLFIPAERLVCSGKAQHGA